MERLGLWGIIKLTTHIILRNLNHFLCITLLFALPLALRFIVLGPFWKAIVSPSLLYKLSTASQDRLHPSDLTPSEQTFISTQRHHSFYLLILLPLFSLVISLLCTLLVTFSVCRACLNKSLDLKGSLRGVPRSAQNLILTVLLVFVVLFIYVMVAMLVIGIIAAGLSAVKVNVAIPITVITIGVVGGLLYISIAFSLANTVAILEGRKGWEAMKRSVYLIQGSRWVLIGLYGFYGVLTMLALLVTASEEASVIWRWGAGGVSVSLQAFMAICDMGSKVVLCMSCKSGYGEPLDTLVAASAQFGPRESAAKYLDLETAALATATTQ